MENQSADKAEEKKEILLSWSSPSRIFKQRTREFYTNIGAIIFLLLVILVFAREFALIAAVLSIVFFIYVTSTVPPQEVEHKITNLGIESAGTYFRYEEIADFWFEKQWDQVKLVFRPIFGTHQIMLLGNQNQEKIHKILSQFIPFRETPQKGWVDNAATWLSEKIPLEKPAS